MRAISIFILDEGISTRGCFASAPFRMRVSKSAMGSVVILSSLPAGLHNAGYFSLERQAAETDTAHLELPERAARAPADPAAIPLANLELQLAFRLRDLTGSSHARRFSLRRALGTEGHAQELQQLAPLLIAAGRRCDCDVHALDLVHARVINFREHQLVLQTQRVVPAAIERIRRQTLEIPHARENNRRKPVQKLVHPLATQRYHAPDGHALANLEVRNGFLRSRDHRLLSGDLAELDCRRIEQLYVLAGFAEADVQ